MYMYTNLNDPAESLETVLIRYCKRQVEWRQWLHSRQQVHRKIHRSTKLVYVLSIHTTTLLFKAFWGFFLTEIILFPRSENFSLLTFLLFFVNRIFQYFLDKFSESKFSNFVNFWQKFRSTRVWYENFNLFQ